MEPVTLSYPLHDWRLDNGLRVVVSPDHSSPVVAVNLWYDVGSGDEVPGRTGFAHLFEHLMFQGSRNVASGDHLGLVQAAGGSVNGTTSFDRTNYFEAVPVGALRLALWLEADRLATLLDALDQDNLDNQRDVVKEEKRQRYDNVPYGDVFEHLVRLVFPADHPYGHLTIGSMADLDAASLDDVRAFFTTHYSPDRAVLTLVGDLTPDEGRALAEEYFGSIPRGPVRERPATAPLPPLSGVPRAEVTAAVPRDAVYLAWRVPAVGQPDLEALTLATAIIGDGLTSRLHRALVREELAEGSSAFVMPLVRGTSLAVAYARCRDDVSPDDLETALLAAWASFVTEGPTPTELHRAQAQLAREWLGDLADIQHRADTIGQLTTQRGDPHRLNTRLAEVQALTVDDVATAARRWLAPSQRAVLIYRAEEAVA